MVDYRVALSVLEGIVMGFLVLIILKMVVAILRCRSSGGHCLVIQARESVGRCVPESLHLRLVDALQLLENSNVIVFLEDLVIQLHLLLDAPENVVDFVLNVPQRSSHTIRHVDVQEVVTLQEYFEMCIFVLLDDLLFQIPSLDEWLKVLSQLIEIRRFQAEGHDHSKVRRLVVTDLEVLILLLRYRLRFHARQRVETQVMVNLPNIKLKIIKLEEHERNAPVGPLLLEIGEDAVAELELDAFDLDLDALAVLPEELRHIDVYFSTFLIVNRLDVLFAVGTDVEPLFYRVHVLLLIVLF